MEQHFHYSIREIVTDISMAKYLQDCVNVPEFLAYCKACPSYGGVWSCPPFHFNPMEIWKKYDSLRLYARVLLADVPGQDVQAAMRALQEEKAGYLDKLLGWEAETSGSLALAAGSCSLCVPCTRKAGKPCQKPEEMRYSIEALGGDVALTASRYLKQPLLWVKDGILPEYLMLVGALLLPAGKAESQSEV